MKLTKTQRINVNVYLARRDMTKRVVAQKLGLAPVTVSNYLSGRVDIPPKHYDMLCKIFPLSKTELKKGNFVFKKGV